VVADGNPDVPKGTFEAWANADDGPPSGRELELASILKFIKDERIRNVVWLTADVHYAAAHHYDPGRAAFTEFTPFWEFVAGSINAGTFGPNALDRTFGIQPVWVSVPAGTKPNRPPSDGMQYFGTMRIDGASEVLTVRLHGLDGSVLYEKQLAPDRT
jgi:alkaline phosphatase D